MQNNNLLNLRAAVKNFNESKFDEAQSLIKSVLTVEPNNFDALHLQGVLFAVFKNYAQSVIFLKRAIEINPKNGLVNFNLAKSLSDNNQDFDSLKFHQNAIRLLPNDYNVKLNYGKSLFKLNKLQEAFNVFKEIVSFNPNNVVFLINLGLVFQKMQMDEDAIKIFDKVVKLDTNNHQTFNYIGTSFMKLKKYINANNSYQKALTLLPNSIETLTNLGILNLEVNNYIKAINFFDTALKYNDNYVKALSFKGLALELQELYTEAIECYSKVLNIQPNRDLILGRLIYAKLKICDWSNLNHYIQALNNSVASPYTLLLITDDATKQLNCALKYSDKIYKHLKSGIHPSQKKFDNKKIKIAYISADFHDHPVMQFMEEVFKSHDKSKFEVYGISIDPTEDNEIRVRFKSYFDKFLDLSNYSDLQIAKFCQNEKIDIAIDLNGYTQNERMAIFAHRCAHRQINYLGYPGTTGSKFHDYIISDNIVIPPSEKINYSEKVKYLSNSFLPPKKNVTSNKKKYLREDYGLPLDKFIFCAFNNPIKINPTIFDAWLKILIENENTILWLQKNNDFTKDNLIKYAEEKGIKKERLIFAGRLPKFEDHLMRYSLADLFLDTYPFNGITTTIDAINANLPILTLSGNSISSRASTSILKNLNLGETIANNLDDYISKAKFFYQNQNNLKAIKNKMISINKNNNENIYLDFTKKLELIYLEIYQEIN